MVTFRNNNNIRRNNYRRGNDRGFKSNTIDLSMALTFQRVKIFRENPQVEIIITSKLIEKYSNPQRRLYLVEIKFYQKTIFNVQIILLEF